MILHVTNKRFAEPLSELGKKLMERARATNAERTQFDLEHGVSAPEDDPVDLLRTAMNAIAAGISVQSWDCVAEGLAMLQTYEQGRT